MKGSWEGKKRLPEIKEKHPQDESAEQNLYNWNKSPEAYCAGRGSNANQTIKTGSTQNPIFMFGNTLPAEKSVTFRATGNGFALLMIPTPFETEFLHY